MRVGAAALLACALCAAGCDDLKISIGGDDEDSGIHPDAPAPMITSACVVDGQYCYDGVSAARCTELGELEGKVMFWERTSCADRAYVQACAGKPGKFQTCPMSGVSGACVVQGRSCHDAVTSERCREIGRSEGDVMYWDAKTCAETGFGEDAGEPDAGFAEDAGELDSGGADA